ncbi:MAG: NAD(+) synthase, partial [Phycisphaerae bacterium]
MKFALAQINPVVSDIAGNRDKIVQYIKQARERGAAVVIFPELAIVGYSPLDLLLKPRFIEAARTALDEIAARCNDVAALVGFPEPNPEPRGRPLYNAVALCRGGRVEQIFRKSLLPTYDVFDECRYFEPGPSPMVAEWPGRDAVTRTGICICEDLWNDDEFVPRPLYRRNPIPEFVDAGVHLLINVSASPFTVEKQQFREQLFAGQAAKHHMPIIVVNQVGGNDELIFDGASCAFDAQGALIARAHAFEEDLLIVEANLPGGRLAASRIEPYPESVASVFAALVRGTHDYVRKCGFGSVVLGLSGGIDSAVTAALAVEALGPDAVHGVAMPSRYSSEHSLADARALASNLGISCPLIPIGDAHRVLEAGLRPAFGERAADITEENLQARIRGLILMALSNKFGHLVLSTGNKSE